MTLDQLRVFVAVADRLHVTQAAAALHMTQSTASTAIHALEARIGMPLFNRVGRAIELSAAGRTLLPEAKSILGRVAQSELIMAELAGLEGGRLVLSASQTIAGYWLPRYIAEFKAKHPKVELSLTIGNTTEAIQRVTAGEADLAFVEGEVESLLLVSTDVATDEMVLVAGTKSPKKTVVTNPSDLVQLDWVLREAGSGTRQVFEAALRGFGLDPAKLKIVLELPSNEAVRSAVEAGAGATVLSRLVAAPGLAAGTLAELPIPFPERHFVALRHGDRHRSHAERAFLDLIKTETR
jgi:DNA-binding transcriptional LysR family regulator